jgi:tetratricopeptide (TPR) repeat protein
MHPLPEIYWIWRLLEKVIAFLTRKSKDEPSPTQSTSTGARSILQEITSRASTDCYEQREKEHNNLVEYLLTDTQPLALIHGGPGLGKSTLALAVFRDRNIAERYKRRVFVRCEGLKTALELHLQVAAKLNIPLHAGDFDIFVNALKKRRTLILFDSLPGVLHPSANELERYVSWFGNDGHVGVIVTSPGHGIPTNVSWRHKCEPRLLEKEAARRVFRHFAGERFAGTSDDDLDALLDQMDGLPLAIKLLGLAASRGFPDIAQLTDVWNKQSTYLLTHGEGAEGLSLNVSLKLSLKSIKHVHRRRTAGTLLKMLSLLPGGISYTDVVALFSNQLSNLADLTYLGLILADEEHTPPHRFRLLNPVRAFIRTKGAPSDAEQLRLAKYYVSLLIQLTQMLGTQNSPTARARLVPEVSNIIAMMRLFLRVGGNATSSVNDAIEAYGRFEKYVGCGSVQPLKDAAEAAKAETIPDYIKEAHCYRAIGEIALVYIELEEEVGRQRDADTWFEKALALYNLDFSCKNNLSKAHCFRGLGDWAQNSIQRDFVSAKNNYRLALEFYRPLGDKKGEANCLSGLAEIALKERNFEGARRLCDQGGTSYRMLESEEGLGNYYLLLGDIATGEAEAFRESNDVGKAQVAQTLAREHYKHALTFYEHIDDPYSIGRVHRQLALISRPGTREQRSHVQTAIAQWTQLKRGSLFIAALRKLFPQDDLKNVRSSNRLRYWLSRPRSWLTR